MNDIIKAPDTTSACVALMAAGHKIYRNTCGVPNTPHYITWMRVAARAAGFKIVWRRAGWEKIVMWREDY